MSVAPVRLHDHPHISAPPEGRGKAGAGGHGHAHSPGHGHDDGHLPHAPARPGSRHHSHKAGERHPSARPGFSLLRLSALQRLAIALPMAVALWAMALAVIGAGA
ncbi:hypothetical protein [Ancylobacter rudongensis]|uniref:Uncharacterized protein n=1 Tax=Ancylobacter rudongensis TaxID=177413 RepID=A0A1G4TZM0_9HYPH|nr:hypothetical protein [Ancylobacter rudongensis]SCW86778.1 hypothetical protein SAMN05660859_3330 [Ancylobacter rudongensis]